MKDSGIAKRLEMIRENIRSLAISNSRPPESIALIAVSKLNPIESVIEAAQAGQMDFGENHVQELVAKHSQRPDLRWHMIGPLQRNKAKLVVPVAKVVHTVDRAELAEELSKRAAGTGKTPQVLLEVNVAGEASKAGCTPEGAVGLAALVRGLPHLDLVGLMTIPPDTDDRELARPFFRRLRELRDALGGGLSELSMGMSHDFAVAIEEGATIVRVGTAIFGART